MDTKTSNTLAPSSLAVSIDEALSPTTDTQGTLTTKNKVAIGFLHHATDVQLVADGNRIVASMTGNAFFPSPFPTLDRIAAAHDAFAAAVNGLDRSRASTVRRDQARLGLTDALRELALYVQHASRGDPDKILSSGFSMQRKRGPRVTEVLAPTIVRVRHTALSGRLFARCKVVAGAKFYQWRIATVLAPTAWTTFDPVTLARFTFENLVPGTQYVMQVRAFARNGSSNWSDGVVMFSN